MDCLIFFNNTAVGGIGTAVATGAEWAADTPGATDAAWAAGAAGATGAVGATDAIRATGAAWAAETADVSAVPVALVI